MLKLSHLSLLRGGKTLFADTSLTIYPGHKAGIVGANGCGKSTLFALIQQQLQADNGTIEQPPRWVSAHVAQETPGLPIAAIDHVLDGDAELRCIEAQLQNAESDDDGARMAQLHDRYDAIDGYSARARAGQIMAGLGFRDEQLEQSVAEFSGGWRVRLNLARALICRSDLLLLDEPTNHLDLDAVLWLEQWLKSYPGTLLLISHDRDFLDNITTHIVHIEHHRLNLYKGDYTAFEQQRAARLALQQALYEKQQRERQHLQQFIDRFRAKATKARQAQSRIKALERMDTIAAAHVDTPFHFSFPAPDKLPNPLLALEHMEVGYGDIPILHNLKLMLQPGARIGLLGPNGAGKSTLIKLLAQEIQPLSGQMTQGQGLAIGYFAQHQLEQLRAEWSPVQHLQQLSPDTSEQLLRNFLGGFGFNGDQALAPVAPFSGGEKARLALALLVWQKPNLLLLDEPTNHLDLEMRHALNLALQDYRGALIIVSHDRHLLRTTTDQLMLVDGGKLQPFNGDLDDYKNWLTEQRSPDKTQKRGADQRREEKRRQAQQRQQLSVKRRPLEKQVKQLEQRMEQLSQEKSKLETELLAEEIYTESNKARLKELLQRQGELSRDLAASEEQWLTLQESLEALSA